MRPVFNDLLTELQRSIGLFHEHRPHGQDRPGHRPGQRHQAALACDVPSQSLGYEIQQVEAFRG